MAADRDDQLAVEHETVGAHRQHRLDQLREIAGERAAGLGLEVDLAAVAEDEAAKAIPFGLILPAFAARQSIDRLRLHRRQPGLHGDAIESVHDAGHYAPVHRPVPARHAANGLIRAADGAETASQALSPKA